VIVNNWGTKHKVIIAGVRESDSVGDIMGCAEDEGNLMEPPSLAGICD
jgi:hypothetical protein